VAYGGPALSVSCGSTATGSHTSFSLTSGSWCLNKVSASGAVTIAKGVNVFITGSTIGGKVSANGGGILGVCGSKVGEIAASNATGFVVIGDPGDDKCAGNTVTNALTLTSNTGGLEVSHNTSIGSIVLNSNSGAGPFADDTGPEVEANKVTGSMSCTGAKPSTDGQPNTVGGSNTCV
jgi:hypothetical protein